MRTLRQPAQVVPTVIFPLFLVAVNAGGLDELPHLYLAEVVRRLRGSGTHRSTAEVIEGALPGFYFSDRG